MSKKETYRKWWLKTYYGLTVEDYENLLDKQKGRCAICSTDDPGGRWKTFAVDHCHETKKIRGLLCLFCNTALGKFKDSSELLRRAADYLDDE